MGQIEEFKHETMPVYKCPKCRWIFAPARNLPGLELDTTSSK